MADLEDLGTPPVFAEIVRVGYAVARLQLPTDPTVPWEVAAAASRVDDAAIALQNAVDLAVELQEEGVRQPVSLVPPLQATLGEERALVWARHAALHANLVEFVGTSVGVPAPQGRATPYETVMMEAAQALGAIEEQRLLAQGSHGPRGPEPPDPAPSPRSRAPSMERDANQRPRADESMPRIDGGRPPAAVAASVTAEQESAHRAPGTQAPTLDDLQRKMRDVSRDPTKIEQQQSLASPARGQVPAALREL